MKKLYSIAIFLLLLSGCENLGEKHFGNGERETRDFEAGRFSELLLSGTIECVLVPGNHNSLQIETDGNLFEYIEVSNRHGVLEIATNGNLQSDEGVKAVLVFENIEGIEVSGACSLKSDGELFADRLSIGMSGAGAIDLEVDVQELYVEISGASAMEISGEADFQKVEMSGAGGYDAFGLVSEVCEVDVSGVGGAQVYVEDRLEAQISGIGGVVYKGEPDEVKSEVSGMGTVSAHNK